MITGTVAAATDLTQDFRAVQARQPHVEDEQIVPALKRFPKTEIAVVHSVQAHAVVRQHLAHHSAQALVIVDQENRNGRFDGACAACSRDSVATDGCVLPPPILAQFRASFSSLTII